MAGSGRRFAPPPTPIGSIQPEPRSRFHRARRSMEARCRQRRTLLISIPSSPAEPKKKKGVGQVASKPVSLRRRRFSFFFLENLYKNPLASLPTRRRVRR